MLQGDVYRVNFQCLRIVTSEPYFLSYACKHHSLFLKCSSSYALFRTLISVRDCTTFHCFKSGCVLCNQKLSLGRFMHCSCPSKWMFFQWRMQPADRWTSCRPVDEQQVYPSNKKCIWSKIFFSPISLSGVDVQNCFTHTGVIFRTWTYLNLFSSALEFLFFYRANEWGPIVAQ